MDSVTITLTSMQLLEKQNIKLSWSIGKPNITLCYCIKEEGEFKHQKAQNNFWSPGENRTHDPLSSSSDAFF